MNDGKRVDCNQSDAKKRRLNTAERIIGIIGSIITIGLFIYSLLFSSGDGKQGGQNISVQVGDNSQAGVIQTENGDVNVNLPAANEALQSSDLQEDFSKMSCTDRLAKSYDLVHKAREMGQYDEAIAIIGEMVKLEGTDLQSMSILQYNLGLMLYESGDMGTAQNAFRNAVKGGGFPDAFYSLGVVCVKIEDEKMDPDYQEAIDAFTRAIKGAEVPEYYRARAWIYEKGGFPEMADEDRKVAERLWRKTEF